MSPPGEELNHNLHGPKAQTDFLVVRTFISGSLSNYSKISARCDKRVWDPETEVGGKALQEGPGLQPSHSLNWHLRKMWHSGVLRGKMPAHSSCPAELIA